MSFIAVSVSLIGLSAAVFTLAILVELIVSFPQMLSSNSRAYVQQQRKVHNISRPQKAVISSPTEAEDEEEQDVGWWSESEDEGDDVVAAVIEVGAVQPTADATGFGPGKGSASLLSRPRAHVHEEEIVTRGRTMRRLGRQHSARTSLRV